MNYLNRRILGFGLALGLAATAGGCGPKENTNINNCAGIGGIYTCTTLHSLVKENYRGK